MARLPRWPDGLHAAVEAKEGLLATDSGEILDSITTQALVRRYPVVCGMTGTAVAVGEQLREFYGLEIAVIPPNRPCIRREEQRAASKTGCTRTGAGQGGGCRPRGGRTGTGRPVLLGTLDVAESGRATRQAGLAGGPAVRGAERQE